MRMKFLSAILGIIAIGTAIQAAEIKYSKAAVMLTSLDGIPLENSKKILLTTVARIAKEKIKWEAKCLAEPVTGHLTLKNSDSNELQLSKY